MSHNLKLYRENPWIFSKLPKSVRKLILYKFAIFRNSIKMWRIKLFERKINQNFKDIEFETFEKEVKIKC